jgi:hypothetical protein
MKDKGHDGWTKVSGPIWKFVSKIPSELVELSPDDGYARLTREGEIVVKWMN